MHEPFEDLAFALPELQHFFNSGECWNWRGREPFLVTRWAMDNEKCGASAFGNCVGNGFQRGKLPSVVSGAKGDLKMACEPKTKV